MYERSAIIIERYFNKMFGYDMKYNLKTNFRDYYDLVKCLEKFKKVSEEEEIVMQEYDSTANNIRDIQKIQENLYKKSAKFEEERNDIFQNIDENVENIKKKLETLNENIRKINDEIQNNASNFINIIDQFNEKSSVRTSCGKNRRSIENDYNRKLNNTLDNFQNVNMDIVKEAKKFNDVDTEIIKEELTNKLIENGAKERIPFNSEVIEKAIDLSLDIQKKEIEILTTIYDKTSRLFIEIKNNTIKSDRHEKIIKDSNCKMDFLATIREYLVLFLDNERLTAVNNIEEHEKLMKEACANLEEDLAQINNLYTLIIKETTKKITKKSYSELYHLEYLKNLQQKAEEFDKKIKKLNLSVTIINPNHWRIEGMKKIYDVFYKCITENYERDLSEFYIENKNEDNFDDDDDINDENNEEELINKKQEIFEKIENEEEIKTTKKTVKAKKENENKRNFEREEIDKKIDMILGFGQFDDSDDYEDDWDNEDEDNEDNEDEFGYDEQEEDIIDENSVYEEDEDDEDYWDDEDDWEEDDDVIDDKIIDEDDWKNDNYHEEDNWDEDDDDYHEDIFNEPILSRDKEEDDDDIVKRAKKKTEQKAKQTKKSNFFSKFKNGKK